MLSLKNDVNVRTYIKKTGTGKQTKKLRTKLIYCWHLESRRQKKQDPDPNQNVTDPEHCF
jgi:hypothetical protein